MCLGPLSPINIPIDKDDTLRKIASNISPMPSGIRIKPLFDGPKTILIIEVEKSEYRPHQFNGRYYMRIDGNTFPAPHYFVEALFRRVSFPNLDGQISFHSIRYDLVGRDYFIRLNVTVTIANNRKLP